MTSISRFGMIALLVAGGFVHTPAVLAQAASPSTNATPKSDKMQTTFGQSLVLRADRIVADPTHTAYCWLGQTSAVAYTSTGALKLKLALQTAKGEPKPVKDLGAFNIFGGNLASDPFPFPVNLSGVPDGDYRYVAEVWDGDVKLAAFEKHIVLVAGLDEKQADFARRLEKITGHDSAKASILYPIDLARVINSGRRIYGDTGTSNPEFGLSQSGALLLYDFSAGLKKSGELLAALESGHDPVWRSGGEMVRHYMPEAGEILPYHVFVTSTWDGHSS